MDTLEITLKAVRESSLLGATSLEITAATNVTNNRITAALSRLTALGCVRREKIYGYAARYRYWYVRELPDDAPPAPAVIDVPVTRKVEGQTPALPKRIRWGVDASGVSISLNIGPRGRIAVTPEQAREVYSQLRVIFGGG